MNLVDERHAIPRLSAEVGRVEHAFLLAERDGVVIATGSASRADDCVTVHRLYVHPAHQRGGIGSTLLAALLDAVGPTARVELRVATANARALAFYRARGFVRCGRDGDDLVLQRTAP